MKARKAAGRKHSRPFSGKSAKDSEVPQVRVFLFLPTTVHARFMSKHTLRRNGDQSLCSSGSESNKYDCRAVYLGVFNAARGQGWCDDRTRCGSGSRHRGSGDSSRSERTCPSGDAGDRTGLPVNLGGSHSGGIKSLPRDRRETDQTPRPLC